MVAGVHCETVHPSASIPIGITDGSRGFAQKGTPPVSFAVNDFDPEGIAER